MLKNRYAACLILMGCMTTAAGVIGFSPAAASATPQVFTVTRVVNGLLHQPRQWEGKTVLVRGSFVAYPGPDCSLLRAHRPCSFHGGLSDSGMYVNLLTLRITPTSQRVLLSKPATYRVRLHLGHYGTTAQPEGYLLAREDHSPLTSVSLAHVSHGKIVVIGGIDPCIGAAPVKGAPRGPRYMAGAVTVLRGQLTWKSIGRGNRTMIFPTQVVGRASVGINRTYRFVLAPGHYVLRAHVPHWEFTPYTEFILKPGTVVHVDIHNMCI